MYSSHTLIVLKRYFLLSLFWGINIASAADFAGVYSGRFSGDGSGWFIVIVDNDKNGYVGYYDTFYQEGAFAQFSVNDDGSFSIPLPESQEARGTIDGDSVSGTVLNTSISFSGQRKNENGVASDLAGIYSGTFSGTTHGNVWVLIAPDGEFWFYADGNQGEDGGNGVLRSNNTFSFTSVFGLNYSGTINPSTLSGNYSAPGYSGTFNLDRIVENPIAIINNALANQTVINDWFRESWFGGYNDSHYPWVYHVDLGWVFAMGDDSSDIWAYTHDMGWMWTNESLFPYVFYSGSWGLLETNHRGISYYYSFTSKHWEAIGVKSSD